jgi:hypothetical protein
MHDMADMVQCTYPILSGVETPDKQFRFGVTFLPAKLNVD